VLDVTFGVVQAPSGTVTFLFTDIEGSTRLWEERPDEMRVAVATHDAIVRAAIEDNDGYVFATGGDGFAAAFGRAGDAVAAAERAQAALAGLDLVKVRMGINTGEAQERGGDYFGPAVNRTARLMAAGHGGQVLIAGVTGELVTGLALRNLGEHRLRDLGSPTLVWQLGTEEFPRLRSLDSAPGNLPRQVTTFVGREREIASLADLVRERSLVTLTGVGGVGKTRLAVQIAAEVALEFPDGAWLCELGSITDPGAVWDALAASLAVQQLPGKELPESVLEYLEHKRLLLVLDNCEHLLSAVAGVADALAQRCAGVSVLATSREGLALGGEQLVAVPSLGVPAEHADRDTLSRADAVRLFCDRAHDAKSDFALTERNAGAIAQLCRRLDGIPLAIELAAARVRSLTPDDLVARLDQRFRLLTRGSRAALERHQTLRNTIDWSYDLLTDTERDALARLSVFAGGCDLAAAEAILVGGAIDRADVVDLLSQLVDKSLVVVDDDEFGTRYRLLETIRQYAQERLESSRDTAAVRRRHADHYVSVAETAGPHLRTRDQLDWTAALARDTDNFRAALDWAVETPSAEHALRLVAPLQVSGIPLGYTANDWVDTARKTAGATTHPLFPLVVAFAALRTTLLGDLEHGAALVATAEQAQETLGTRHLWLHAAAGTNAFFRGEVAEAARHAEEWVELARATGDPYEISHALIMLGAAQFAAPGKDADQAKLTLEEAVRIARTEGLVSSLLYALIALVTVLPPDDAEQKLKLLDEAIDVATKLGDRQDVAIAIAMQGGIAAQRGDHRVALRASVNAAERQLEVGESLGFTQILRGAAIDFVNLGHLEAGAVLIGFADARAERRGPELFLEQLEAAESTLSELGEQRVAKLKEIGAALRSTDVVAYLRAQADTVLQTN
jgi:predicted ATPase/class 3 adenylate cyclase